MLRIGAVWVLAIAIIVCIVLAGCSNGKNGSTNEPGGTIAAQPGGPADPPEEEPGDTELYGAMLGSMAGGAAAITSAAQQGDLDAVAEGARKLRDDTMDLCVLGGVPTEREELDAFTGYADDLIADTSAVIEAAESGDLEATKTASETLTTRGCVGCHEAFGGPTPAGD